VAEILGEYARKGIDPLTVVATKAHDVGLQIHASIRMNPDYSPDWIGAWLPNTYNDTFYFGHDLLRIRNRDGSRGGHLSYAYEEMQKRKLLLAEELLAYPVDGVNLDFLRHPPFVGYDPPLVERFIREYGEDPRRLEEDDPRWIRCMCGPMTDYVRAVRNIAGERVISAGGGDIEFTVNIAVNESKTPRETGMAVREEVEGFIRSARGRRIIQQSSMGR